MATASRKSNALLRGLAVLGNLGSFIFPLGAIALLSVPGVLAYQTIRWLEDGTWPAISFRDGLEWAGLTMPRFETHAIQQASEQLLASPLSLVLLFGIGGPLFLYARFSKWLEKSCEPEKVPFE